jgi:hypothetical protein
VDIWASRRGGIGSLFLEDTLPDLVHSVEPAHLCHYMADVNDEVGKQLLFYCGGCDFHSHRGGLLPLMFRALLGGYLFAG